MSLRGRLLASLALVALVSCVLTVGIGLVLVRAHVADQRLTQLRNEAALISLRPAAQRTGDHVYRVDVRPARPARPKLAAAVLRAIGSTADGSGTIHLRRRTLLYVARSSGGSRTVVIGRAAVRFADLRPFLEALGIAGLAAALLAVGLGFLLARRLARPIAALAGATRRLRGGDTDVAVPVDGDDELAELGRSFNAMAAELGRTREDQRAFLESVSHELKTPLTSVRGYAEALADDAIAPEEAGRVIAAEAERLSRLVSDLLDLARFGRSDFSVRRVPVDLSDVAAAAADRHRVRARALGVTLAVEVGSAPHRALADEGRLVQACSNLVENALRLLPAGGRVTVAVDGCALVVCDDGPGLRDADLGRAFERFYLHDRYRADPGRAVGSGLGLAIVAELVGAMGGTVRAAHRPGGGAAFTIALAPAPAAPAVSPSGARQRPRAR